MSFTQQTLFGLTRWAKDISEGEKPTVGLIPAGCVSYAQHPDAFALTLIHQIIIFLNLLIGPVRSHFEPVIQPTTAGL